MAANTSHVDTSGMKDPRRTVALISCVLVAGGCALSITQTVLYPGEFVITAILSVVFAVVTLRRAWLVGVSRRGENLALTKRLSRWLALSAVVAAAALYVTSTTGQRQFLGIAASTVILVGYLSMVLLFDSVREPNADKGRLDREKRPEA